MTTDKQKAANGRNGKKSTGPKSRKGKEKSRMNAMKHGLTAKQIVLSEEDPKAFEALRHDLVEYFQPFTLIQEFLVDQLAMLMWKLRRAGLLEQALFEYQSACAKTASADADFRMALGEGESDRTPSRSVQMQSKKLKVQQAQYKGKAQLGFALVNDAKNGNVFAKLSAYDARNLRDFHRTWEALKSDFAEGRAEDGQATDPQALVQDRTGPKGETHQIEGSKGSKSPPTA